MMWRQWDGARYAHLFPNPHLVVWNDLPCSLYHGNRSFLYIGKNFWDSIIKYLSWHYKMSKTKNNFARESPFFLYPINWKKCGSDSHMFCWTPKAKSHPKGSTLIWKTEDPGYENQILKINTRCSREIQNPKPASKGTPGTLETLEIYLLWWKGCIISTIEKQWLLADFINYFSWGHGMKKWRNSNWRAKLDTISCISKSQQSSSKWNWQADHFEDSHNCQGSSKPGM